ncbi:MAG: RNA polymerase sigma factor [Dorea sp.]|jgi:RNA polymerase sigma factor (sigma-70 family)|uniref:RNA polymerase sigma factor n=1 Tax=Sporofaciens sp. JLR.KK001 TaxID=3112621 RepID=UPI00216F60B3|nr:RNA polymerase sigma factor [Dorea sp.]MCI9619393.1 RNA polymerase sigma factor [Dorea sp.]
MDFEEMYRLYFKDVYLFILAMSKSPDIAEEITQETFFKVLKNINKYRGECSVKTWLFQIAKNTYLSHIKKTKHQETEDKISDSESSSQHSMESMCISKDEALSIYKVLHYLEEPYKEVFTLRTLGELSFREIGEIFGRKEGWARVTYHRAKSKIREQIIFK